jgi:hypothetical protein
VDESAARSGLCASGRAHQPATINDEVGVSNDVLNKTYWLRLWIPRGWLDTDLLTTDLRHVAAHSQHGKKLTA